MRHLIFLFLKNNKEKTKENINMNFKYLQHLYHLRDFEIKNLWQRSVFLAGFIGLLFTGYGTVINKMIDYIGSSIILLNLIVLAICLLGFVFSILWTMMAKGSKAWYEVYERKIELFEDKLEICDLYKYNIKKNDNAKDLEINDFLLSTKAGAYSVSKINILIGIVLLIIWSVLFLIHLIILIYLLCNTKCCDKFVICIVLLCMTSLLGYIIIYYFLTHSAKSSSLTKNK